MKSDLFPKQTLDKVLFSWFCHQPTQSSNIQSKTKSGHMLNLDNVGANIGFIASKRCNSGEVLDKLSTDLVAGQTPDKVWI